MRGVPSWAPGSPMLPSAFVSNPGDNLQVKSVTTGKPIPEHHDFHSPALRYGLPTTPLSKDGKKYDHRGTAVLGH